VGACSGGADEESIKLMKVFGENVGMAFQIKDDLFDYGELEIGKPLGIDIKEKKMTLPLIYALQKSSWLEKKEIVYKIKHSSHKKKVVKEIIQYVKDSDGIQYANEKMKAYQDNALKILDNFKDSVYKESLINLVQFTIERTK
jgi:octaprenyl-diphosphate synthase